MKKEQYIGIVVAIVVAVIFFVGIGRISSLFTNSSNLQETMSEDIKLEVIAPGTGTEGVVPGDMLTVHYTGMFADGKKFDSSLDRGTPFQFKFGMGQVIKGWDKGLMGAKVGDKVKLTIPGNLAYGESGVPDGRGGFVIPPNATLIFEIEVLKVEKISQ